MKKTETKVGKNYVLKAHHNYATGRLTMVQWFMEKEIYESGSFATNVRKIHNVSHTKYLLDCLVKEIQEKLGTETVVSLKFNLTNELYRRDDVFSNCPDFVTIEKLGDSYVYKEFPNGLFALTLLLVNRTLISRIPIISVITRPMFGDTSERTEHTFVKDYLGTKIFVECTE